MADTELRPLRLGVVSTFPPSKSSLNEYGWHLVQGLVARADVASVTVFADEHRYGVYDPPAGVDVQPCWEFNSVVNVGSVLAAVRSANVDAVLLNLQFASFGDRPVAGGLGLLLPALLSQLDIPCGVILHNLVDEVDLREAGITDSPWMDRLFQLGGAALTRGILRAGYVAVTLPRYADRLAAVDSNARVRVVRHGSFDRPDTPTFGIPSSGPNRILAFGKFGTYKRIDSLIHAYRQLLATGDLDIELVIAGSDHPATPGYLASVAKRCRDLPNVRFTGYVPDRDVADLFQSASTVVFPYTSTAGSSGVLNQAGSFGRSVVLPKLGDFVELIEAEGFVGHYFDPGSPSDLASAIRRALSDRDLAAAHGKQNFAAASQAPMSEVAQAHMDLLRELVDAKAARERIGSEPHSMPGLNRESLPADHGDRSVQEVVSGSAELVPA